MTFFRKLLSSSSSFERELNKAIQQEVRAMDGLAASMAPKVYSYQVQAAGSGAAQGAFAKSQVAMRQVRVEKPVMTTGLFHP